MPFEPLRFIHAAHACLDRPLRDTGALSDEARQTVAEATLTAFEQVISSAIDRQVDFLLLTSNSFHEKDRSLQARVALLHGFQRLAERGIQVFVMPGESDPAPAWRSIPNLPANVTPFFDKRGEPVAVVREGKVIASVTAGSISQVPENRPWHEQGETPHEPITGSTRRVPFAIGLADAVDEEGSADYQAFGGDRRRRTIKTSAGLAHCPGSMQGLDPGDVGPRGCTLVEVGSEGELTRTFLPTAPVRWEAFTLQVNAQTGWDELAEQMRSALARCRPETVEKLWLVTWTLYGCGPLFESLHDTDFRNQLTALVEQDDSVEDRPPLNHKFRLLPDTEAAGSMGRENRLAADYFEFLENGEPSSAESLVRCLEEASLPNVSGTERLHSLVAEMDREAVAGHARRWGMAWFGARAEGLAQDENRTAD